MDCNFPPPLTEDEITAALDGVAEARISEHLAHCTGCATRLNQARQVEDFIKSEMPRHDCPTPDQLRDYHFELLNPTEMYTITRHLEHCADCQDEIQELQEFLATDIIRHPPRPEPTSTTLPQIGELIAQILSGPPALAARGTSPTPLIATIGATTIVIEVQPIDEDQVLLVGQVATANQEQWTGALVELRQVGVVQAVGGVDALGEFRCGPIRAERTEVRIIPQRNLVIVVPKIELKS